MFIVSLISRELDQQTSNTEILVQITTFKRINSCAYWSSHIFLSQHEYSSIALLSNIINSLEIVHVHGE